MICCSYKKCSRVKRLIVTFGCGKFAESSLYIALLLRHMCAFNAYVRMHALFNSETIQIDSTFAIPRYYFAHRRTLKGHMPTSQIILIFWTGISRNLKTVTGNRTVSSSKHFSRGRPVEKKYGNVVRCQIMDDRYWWKIKGSTLKG